MIPETEISDSRHMARHLCLPILKAFPWIDLVRDVTDDFIAFGYGNGIVIRPVSGKEMILVSTATHLFSRETPCPPEGFDDFVESLRETANHLWHGLPPAVAKFSCLHALRDMKISCRGEGDIVLPRGKKIIRSPTWNSFLCWDPADPEFSRWHFPETAVGIFGDLGEGGPGWTLEAALDGLLPPSLNAIAESLAFEAFPWVNPFLDARRKGPLITIDLSDSAALVINAPAEGPVSFRIDACGRTGKTVGSETTLNGIHGFLGAIAMAVAECQASWARDFNFETCMTGQNFPGFPPGTMLLVNPKRTAWNAGDGWNPLPLKKSFEVLVLHGGFIPVTKPVSSIADETGKRKAS